MLGLWAVARFVAAFTWRDAQVLGPLVADQLILLALVADRRRSAVQGVATAIQPGPGSPPVALPGSRVEPPEPPPKPRPPEPPRSRGRPSRAEAEAARAAAEAGRRAAAEAEAARAAAEAEAARAAAEAEAARAAAEAEAKSQFKAPAAPPPAAEL